MSSATSFFPRAVPAATNIIAVMTFIVVTLSLKPCSAAQQLPFFTRALTASTYLIAMVTVIAMGLYTSFRHKESNIAAVNGSSRTGNSTSRNSNHKKYQQSSHTLSLQFSSGDCIQTDSSNNNNSQSNHSLSTHISYGRESQSTTSCGSQNQNITITTCGREGLENITSRSIESLDNTISCSLESLQNITNHGESQNTTSSGLKSQSITSCGSSQKVRFVERGWIVKKGGRSRMSGKQWRKIRRQEKRESEVFAVRVSQEQSA
ncbi:hypothetical protein B0T09DRAFT_385527 [Sordaria sp. MPI-SDFR-AT-0083]|nr:hypothetical protein B0T09DRAFT_385527 [Sordaria sp. MPI-SDFR-AT-0083]